MAKEKTMDEIAKIADLTERVNAYKELIEAGWKSKILDKENYLTLTKFFDEALKVKDAMSIDALARTAKVELKAGKAVKDLSEAKKFCVKLLNMLITAIKNALT